MKQETPEEAAELYSKNISTWTKIRNNSIRDFIAGAKWQQERMYSEEEVEILLLDCRSENPIDVSKWFKQFKKK